MRCPVCDSEDTKVVDSRPSADGFGIRRRRECAKCENRFSTVEQMELLDLTLIKSDGRREPYARGKLESGLKKALEKRPHSAESFAALVGAIERDIQRKKKDELPTAEIGEIVIRHLRRFDPVAYIRFASVYRSFDDISRFQDELEKMTSKKGPGK